MLEQYLKRLHELPQHEQKEVLKLVEQVEAAQKRESLQDDFLKFTKELWPDFIEGRHHVIMAQTFNRVARGECKRVIINMPPRHGKSQLASIYLPAWFLGKFPKKKIIQASHTAELAVGFGRKVRNIVGTNEYQGIFPGTGLRADSKAAGRWDTSKGGEYFAVGVGGAIAGKGADLLIIDDPHDEQEGQRLDAGAYASAYEWYTSGPRQRLQPNGSIILVMTRWHQSDLTGQILKSSMQRVGADEWEVIQFPALMPSGRPLWPDFWSKTELEALKAELPAGKWAAQYQQDPTSETVALIKRDWWQRWTKPRAPECQFIIMSWDTAFLKTERSDYSACTVWGVFETQTADDKLRSNIILLDAFKERLEFPELKERAYREWKKWKPDAFVVEAKAAGSPLIFELRQKGIPVQEFTPSRGQDKIARVNAVSDIFASGMVWAPETRAAEEVIEECAAFPVGSHDDLVDSTVQALLRYRKGGFIRLDSDDDQDFRRRRKHEYY